MPGWGSVCVVVAILNRLLRCRRQHHSRCCCCVVVVVITDVCTDVTEIIIRRGGSTLGQGARAPIPDSIVAPPQIQKLAGKNVGLCRVRIFSVSENG